MNIDILDFPGGSEASNLPVNAGDMALIPGPGRFHILSPLATASKVLTLELRVPQQEKPLQ